MNYFIFRFTPNPTLKKLSIKVDLLEYTPDLYDKEDLEGETKVLEIFY